MLNVSLVLYKTDEKELESCIKSISGFDKINKIYLIDNSPDERLKIFKNFDKRIVYIFNEKNLGFGKAHNMSLRKSIRQEIKYHLVLNADTYFDSSVISDLVNFMEKYKEVGLIGPKILYPDGSLQYSCRLLPDPLDLFIRRFLDWGLFKKFVEKRKKIYELRFTNYNKIMEVPFISGSFMFFRIEALKKVGLFDEQFFMYMEDVDLSRRIFKNYKVLFYPEVHIFHIHKKGSYRNKRLLYYHINSAVKYFNKWGWFRDAERNKINTEVLRKLGYKGLH